MRELALVAFARRGIDGAALAGLVDIPLAQLEADARAAEPALDRLLCYARALDVDADHVKLLAGVALAPDERAAWLGKLALFAASVDDDRVAALVARFRAAEPERREHALRAFALARRREELAYPDVEAGAWPHRDSGCAALARALAG